MTERKGINMPGGIRALWVDALRSGHYQQTREVLYDHTGYCCLGVLVDVAAPEEWVTIGDQTGVASSGAKTSYGELSDKLRERFGLSDYECNFLMGANDEERWSFSEIADWIEFGIIPEHDEYDASEE
jgi:hypothetical protein